MAYLKRKKKKKNCLQVLPLAKSTHGQWEAQSELRNSTWSIGEADFGLKRKKIIGNYGL